MHAEPSEKVGYDLNLCWKASMACTDTSHTSKVGQDRLRESSVKYELSVWKRKTALVSTPCRHVNVFIENEIG